MQSIGLAPLLLALTSAVSLTALAGAQTAGTTDDVQELQRLQAEKQELVRQVQRELSTLPKDSARYKQLSVLLVEVKKRDRAMARTRYLTPATADPALRAYYLRIQTNLEKKGTTEFPTADGQPLYGRVQVSFALRPSGQIERIDISQSDSPLLARHVVQLLKRAAPFDAFPPEIAREFDRIVISVPFNYEHR